MIKLTSDRSTIVDTKIKWIPIVTLSPERGAKCLLIDRRYGAATLGEWKPEQKWTHWHPLPTFLTDEDDA